MGWVTVTSPHLSRVNRYRRLMRQSFGQYQQVGYRFVRGWLELPVLDVMQVLDKAQRANGVSGSAAEIGVHHGKLFIALHLLRQAGEASVAIDLFEDQELNIDQSGHGDAGKLTANLKRWTDNSDVIYHRGDSTQLSGSDVVDLAGSPVRMFSVDGGHTEEIVLKDMQTAEEALADGGIVIADDVFNSQWPGVVVGTLKYLERDEALVPFAVGFNKVFFADAKHAPGYRHVIAEAFQNRLRIERKTSVMGDHEVEVLFSVPLTPRRALGRSAVVRRVYQSLNSK